MSEIAYPKGERAWTGYYNRKGELLFVLTTKPFDRSWFFLYENRDGTLKKLGKAHSPAELEEKYKVTEKMFA